MAHEEDALITCTLCGDAFLWWQNAYHVQICTKGVK